MSKFINGAYKRVVISIISGQFFKFEDVWVEMDTDCYYIYKDKTITIIYKNQLCYIGLDKEVNTNEEDHE